jgi:membrane associated rhomboid family serine protease
MGLYDRDYYRDDASRNPLLGGLAPTTRMLIGITVGVYILQLLTGGQGGAVTTWLRLDPGRVVFRFEIWRLLTYAFCHGSDLWHIVGNMYFFWICGRSVEAIYGPREFLRFYLAAAVFSGIGFSLMTFLMGTPAVSVGASGAVMAVVMLCALYHPTQTLLFLFIIPIQLRWLVFFYAIFDLHPVLVQWGGGEVRSHVAHSAHLAGYLFGYLYKRFDLRFSRIFAGIRIPGGRQMARSATGRRASTVKLYQPPEEPESPSSFERRVDEILAKITAEGESSLTDAEREILKEASRRYKDR